MKKKKRMYSATEIWLTLVLVNKKGVVGGFSQSSEFGIF